MPSNYLPFAMRESFIVPAGGTAALSVVAASFSGRYAGARVEYQDVWISFAEAQTIDPLCRYGFEGRGYLIEEPVSLAAVAQNAVMATRQGWRFAHPYRLDPGQMMRVDYDLASAGVFGAMFHCKRADNASPFYLYGSNIVGNAANIQGSLMTEYLRCPNETPLYIEGVSATGAFTLTNLNNEVGVQIYDGNGRELLLTKSGAGTTTTQRQMHED
jgi:hypothetical protein